MTDLNGSTLLALVPGTRTRSDGAGHVLVETPSGTVVDAGPGGYEILALFTRPRALGDALAVLARRAHPMQEATAVMNLIETGALTEAGSRGPQHGWTDPVDHARMINDSHRTGAYVDAIRASVNEGDVVVDIGTGTGFLAVAAARAGARHVYAVEASDIADVAQRVFDVNGVADRVTLIEGWSNEVELPEPADLLVTETIGTDPFEEDILETTLDARQRLLRPDARIIPRTLRLFVRALRLPDGERRANRIDEEAIEDWMVRYGIDLQPMLEAAREDPIHVPTEIAKVAGWERLGGDAELLNVDLANFTSPAVHAIADMTIEKRGPVDAVLVTFKAELAQGVELVNEPQSQGFSSWASSVWYLQRPLDIPEGGKIRVEYVRRMAGRADGLRCFEID